MGGRWDFSPPGLCWLLSFGSGVVRYVGTLMKLGERGFEQAGNFRFLSIPAIQRSLRYSRDIVA